jgi:hypothetical protein
MTRTPENYGDATSGVSHLMLAPLTLRSGSTARAAIDREKNVVLSLRVPIYSSPAKQGARIDLNAGQSQRR